MQGIQSVTPSAHTPVSSHPYIVTLALWTASVATAAVVVGLIGLAHVSAYPRIAPATVGYRDHAYGLRLSATADKPESKLWWNDGDWWADMHGPVDGARHIFRLDAASQRWEDTGTLIDPRPRSHSDVLWDGEKLYVASRDNEEPAILHRFSYDPSTRRYSPDSGFPVSITDRPVSSVVIDKDSTGRVWATFSLDGKIWVNRTEGDDAVWGAPFVLPFPEASVDEEDLASIVKFGGDRVGVLWGNQLDGKFYFAIHRDSDPDEAWTLEVAQARPHAADNHVNLKADSSGRVYAAVKTSIKDEGPDAPLIELLVREPSGGWSAHTVSTRGDEHTTPLVVLDEQNRQVYLFAVRPGGGNGGGTVYMKAAPMEALEFPPGLGTIVLASTADPKIHNPTSTKQALNGSTDLVLLASDKTTGVYLHNTLDLPGGDRLRFAALADFGNDASHGAKMRDVSRMIESWHPAFIVTAGDNNYPDGRPETLDSNVGKYIHSFIAPYDGDYGAGADINRFFPALGIHDWRTADAKPYLDYFTLPGNERYYDVLWDPVHVFVLNSDPDEPDGVTAYSEQARWLRQGLADSPACWKVVVAHHAPFSSSVEHGSSVWMRWPFREWGADAMLAAHDHTYERVMADGFPYFVNGLGGDNADDFGPPVPGSEARFNGDRGAMRITADRQSLTFEFLTRRGVLVDSYSMSKNCE